MAFEIENGQLLLYTEEDGLTEITVPEGVTSIHERAFFQCRHLTSVTIPEGVTYIGPWAFRGCTGLTSVHLPDSLTRVLQAAFADCTSLKEITIPRNTAEFGARAGDAIQNCGSLTALRVDQNNAHFSDIDGILYDKAGKKLLRCPNGLSVVRIPEGVQTIRYQAFRECKKLSSLTLPESLTTIESQSFSWCDCLRTLAIPAGVTNIGSTAFAGTALTRLYLDGRYEIIGLRGAMSDLDKAIAMLRNRDFSAHLETGLKYPFLLACYKAERDPDVLTVIRKQAPKYTAFAIEAGDAGAVQALAETEGFFTKRSIDKYISLAIEKEQHEIYTFLLHVKRDRLGFRDIESRFQL